MGPHNPNILCKNCGTSLTHDISVPSSPAPHLHRTIQAPDASEFISIRETLSYAKPDLHQLDDDIKRMQTVLGELQRKRRELHKFILEHDAFLAPVRLLPLEILTEIFVLCMPKWENAAFSSQRVPLIVGQVCAGWRHAALSTQTLWSSITVAPVGCPSTSLVRAWISRAISSPLKIRFDADYHPKSAARRMWPTIAELVQYCDRWKDIEIALPASMVYRFYPVTHRLPWLESLRFDRRSTREPWPRELNIFEYAPRLRRLYISLGISHKTLKLPWAQLTELEAFFDNITICLETLQLVPNIVKCTLHCDSWFEEDDYIVSHYIPNLQFPHLLFLHLYIVGNPTELFNCLQIPKLHSIRVISSYNPLQSEEERWISQQPFISFLSRCHNLCSLTINGILEGGERPNLARCLGALPSLTHLAVIGANGWFTSDIFGQLTPTAPSGISGTCLVPQLEVLKIGDTFVDLRLFAKMIESRRVRDDSRNVAQLKDVRFELYQLPVDDDDDDIQVSIEFDAEALDLLRSCQDEGMNISIIDIKNDRKDLLVANPTYL